MVVLFAFHYNLYIFKLSVFVIQGGFEGFQKGIKCWDWEDGIYGKGLYQYSDELVKNQMLGNNAQQNGRIAAKERQKESSNKEVTLQLQRFSKASLRKAIDEDHLIKSSLLSDSTKTSQIEMASFDDPTWVNSYKECVSLLKEVQDIQNEITKQKRKKLTAVCEKKHDTVIQKFVAEATFKLNTCEKKLKEMQMMANFNIQGNETNKKTFTSMMMAMASNIREEARRLRGQQQSQLHRERQLKKYESNILSGAQMQTQKESWLSQQDFQMLQQSFVKERDQQINKIVQSIYSLNSIYKQFQGLVIEQGSLLDRIDQNINSAVQNVHKANQHLEQACKKQQNSCFTKLRLILIVLIGIFFIIFILKHL